MNTRTRIPSLAIAFLAWPFLAWAVDGQIDIATLPFTISEPGSYVVVADLRMGTPDVSGIVILGTNDVTLDLNGHTLAGAGQSAGTYGSGIFVPGYAENIVIRNGTLRDWRLDGIQAPEAIHCVVENVISSWNGGWGILTGHRSRIEGCIVEYNGGGIATGNHGILLHNQSVGSLANTGIQTGSQCEIRDNVSTNNFLDGLWVEDGSTIVGNICTGNLRDGLVVYRKSIVEGNVCNNNGGTGIRATATANVITGNICSTNGGDGIRVRVRSVVANNRCSNNGRIDVESADIRALEIGNEIRDNSCLISSNGIVLEGTGNVVAGNRLVGNATPVVAVPGNQLDIVIGGLPFVISSSGIYRLPGTLNMDEPGTHGITIRSDNVTLDFGGHALIGPGKEAGSIGSGVWVDGSYGNLVIANGTVQDWRENGVASDLAKNSRYENLRGYRNGEDGLSCGGGAVVSEVSAEANGGTGLVIGSGSIVSRCAASNNEDHGIKTSGGTVQDSVFQSNGANGIYASEGATVVNCTSGQNGAAGILATNGCSVRGNTCATNTAHGIDASTQCHVIENTCHHNGPGEAFGAGIRITGFGCAVERNLVTENDTGIHCNPDGGNYFGSNRANGNVTHYDLGTNAQGSGDLANIFF